MKIKTYVELNKPNSKGEAVIILRCRIDKKRMSFSTGISINQNDWNKSKKIVRQSDENATNYNNLLEKYKNSIFEIVSKAELRGIDVSKEYIQQRLSFTSKEQMSETIEEHFKDFLEIKKSQVADSTINKYEKMFSVLKIVCNKYNTPFTYNIFNDVFFSRLLEYLHCNGLTNITIKTYQKKLTAFLNWCTEMEYNENLKYKKFNIKYEEPEIFPLNEDEIKKIEGLKLDKNDYKNLAKDIFLFLVYTGMRFSEAMLVKKSHINENMIRFKSKKVQGGKYLIPITMKTQKIIEKYSNRKKLTKGCLLPQLSNTLVNKNLKEIGKLANLNRDIVYTKNIGLKRIEKKMKLYEQLSCHDGRRTFITHCLRKGMNAQMIMKITGHTNYSTFERYINFDDNDLTKSLNFVWN